MLHSARLRGHHLFCLAFFRGLGYGKEFVDGLFKVLELVRLGGAVEVVEGLDDVCGFCPHNVNGVCGYFGIDLAGVDRYALDLLGLAVGDRIGYRDILAGVCREYVRWRHAVCLSCSWRYVCDPTFKSIPC